MSVHPLAEPFVADGDATSPHGRVGVLLSHGFTGSPASMKPWAEHLAAQGYAVSVPRLPGHGTTWQEMNKTTWADWYGEIERAFEALADQVDAVVVGGLSMGGAPGAAARRGPPRPRRRPGGRQPGGQRPSARTSSCCRCSSTSSRRCPGSPTTSRSPASRSTATPRRRCRPRTRCSRPGKVLRRRPAEDHLPDPAASARPRTTSWTRRAAASSGRRSPRATSARRCSRTATTSRRSTTTPSRSSRGRSAFVERVAGLTSEAAGGRAEP